MRITALFVLGVAAVVGKVAFAESKASLQTVPHVDLTRYLGRWYEIARYPTRFEKDCASDVTATYTQLSGGKVEVLNECRKADGQVKRSKGTAGVVDKRTNAKLKVTFFWPFSGNYWIIDLAPDYSYAVVGNLIVNTSGSSAVLLSSPNQSMGKLLPEFENLGTIRPC